MKIVTSWNFPFVLFTCVILCTLAEVCQSSGRDPCVAEGGNDCVFEAKCIFFNGSFVCSCPSDYKGDGRATGTGCTWEFDTPTDHSNELTFIAIPFVACFGGLFIIMCFIVGVTCLAWKIRSKLRQQHLGRYRQLPDPEYEDYSDRYQIGVVPPPPVPNRPNQHVSNNSHHLTARHPLPRHIESLEHVYDEIPDVHLPPQPRIPTGPNEAYNRRPDQHVNDTTPQASGFVPKRSVNHSFQTVIENRLAEQDRQNLITQFNNYSRQVSFTNKSQSNERINERCTCSTEQIRCLHLSGNVLPPELVHDPLDQMGALEVPYWMPRPQPAELMVDLLPFIAGDDDTPLNKQLNPENFKQLCANDEDVANADFATDEHTNSAVSNQVLKNNSSFDISNGRGGDENITNMTDETYNSCQQAHDHDVLSILQSHQESVDAFNQIEREAAEIDNTLCPSNDSIGEACSRSECSVAKTQPASNEEEEALPVSANSSHEYSDLQPYEHASGYEKVCRYEKVPQ